MQDMLKAMAPKTISNVVIQYLAVIAAHSVFFIAFLE